jgi:hypothetical protein
MVISNWSILTANTISFDESTIKQTDLLSYFIPPIIHSIWGDQFIGLYSRLSSNGLFRPYIGFAVIFLVLATMLAREKEARPWLISSGIWLLLAAGSVLRFNGVVYEQFQLPYHWISTIFPLSVVRAPDRFNLLFVFSFAVLAGIGAASMARHPHLRRAVWVLGLLIVIEYLMIPIPRWKLPPGSSFLDRISVDEEAYAVIDYPMGYKNSKFWLYFQTLHDKPMVEGHISRYTPDTYAFIANQPVLNSFYQTAKPPKYLPDNFFKPPSQSPIAIGPAIRDLQAENVRYILIHRRYASDEDLAILDSILPLLPNYQDNFLTVFDLTHPRLLLLGETSSSISPVIDLVQATTQLDPSETAVELQLLTQMTSDRHCHSLYQMTFHLASTSCKSPALASLPLTS